MCSYSQLEWIHLVLKAFLVTNCVLCVWCIIMVNWLSLMLEVSTTHGHMHPYVVLNGVTYSAGGVSPGVSVCIERCSIWPHVHIDWSSMTMHVCMDRSSMTRSTLTGLHWPTLMFHMTSDISAHPTLLWYSSTS